MRHALSWIYAPALAHWRALLALSLIYFGALGLGIVITAFAPNAQATLLQSVGEGLSPTGSLGPLVQAYTAGQLPAAILLTFLVNLFAGSALFLTLPTLVIPFAGLATGVFRGVLWGILFSPLGGPFGFGILPHVPVMLLEGEAYVLAMLGVWFWWWPVVSTPGKRWSTWWQGLLRQGRVYVAVACTLLVAAIYEAVEVIYLLPLLME